MSIRDKVDFGYFILTKKEFDCFNYYYGSGRKYSPRVWSNQELTNVISSIKRK